ncbi:MAG: hypothetical protein ACI8RD_012625, partial [Bacillariaceae sp.]
CIIDQRRCVGKSKPTNSTQFLKSADIKSKQLDSCCTNMSRQTENMLPPAADDVGC